MREGGENHMTSEQIRTLSKKLASISKFLIHEAQSMDDCCHGVMAEGALLDAAQSIDTLVKELDLQELDVARAETRQTELP
jgi:hypothetical protein